MMWPGSRRIVVSTYQSVSGTGKRAIRELENQVLAIYKQQEIKKEVYPHQIAFNCLPHIDVFLRQWLHQGRDEDGE